MRNNARRMNQNQRYEVLMHFPGYEGSPYGIPRGEYAAKLRDDEPKTAQKRGNCVSPNIVI